MSRDLPALFIFEGIARKNNQNVALLSEADLKYHSHTTVRLTMTLSDLELLFNVFESKLSNKQKCGEDIHPEDNLSLSEIKLALEFLRGHRKYNKDFISPGLKKHHYDITKKQKWEDRKSAAISIIFLLIVAMHYLDK